MNHKKNLDELMIAASENIEEKSYWLNQLAGELVKNYFPYDYNKKANDKSQFELVKSSIPKELGNRLLEASRDSDVRLFTIIAAGLAILLSKYTHNDDITIGTPIYKQNTDSTFINTVLPLRNRVRKDITFKELLVQMGQCIFQANHHQNYPIEIALKLLNIPYSENDDFPLFDVAILAENLHEKDFLRHILLNLYFNYKRTGEDLELMVEYNPLRYNQVTVSRIVTHFINLLINALSNANLRISNIGIMSENELREILFEFNETKANYPREKTMHLLFEEQVEKTPDHIAAVGIISTHPDSWGNTDTDPFFQGEGPNVAYQSITYNELNKKSNQIGHELRSRGVKPNQCTAIIMNRTIEMVIGVMAILKAGGAYVPLEPYLPEARIITCLASLNVKHLLTNQAQLTKINLLSSQLPELNHIFCLDGYTESYPGKGDLFANRIFIAPSQFQNNPEKNLLPTAVATDIAYVIFTSGTTGTPKGVIEQHRPVINIIQWVNGMFAVSGREKLLFVASLSFDLSVYDIFGVLAAGGSIRVVTREEMKCPDYLLGIIYKEGITFWDSAPATLQQLVPYILEVKDTPGEVTSALRLVFLSGDWIPVTISDILKEVFKGVRVIALGGATEATIWSNYYPIEIVNPDWNSIPYGKPIYNAKYYILDSDLSPCPIGVPGDLFIGGECLATGYINEVELTSNKFINNPFVTGEKIYRTGDMAQWYPDGNMEFLGRLDNQVKIRGYRIELGEIESQLNTHPEIKSAVVIARGTQKDDKFLCSYYVADNELSNLELHEYLAKTLPEYMIPPYFIKLDKIPITANGKLDRKALPGPDTLVDMKTYFPPQDDIDETIIDIWSEILQTKKHTISIDADFFEMGGHSLSATKMLTSIHKALDVKVPLAELFKYPTVRKLSTIIKGMAREQFIEIHPIEKKEYYPVSSSQKRLYVLHQLDENSTRYNMSIALEFINLIDKSHLQKLFKQILRRHESLRTSFIMQDGEPVQRLHEEIEFNLEYYEVPKGQLYQQEIPKLIKKIVRSFDLSTPPLMRAGLVKISETQFILVVDIHHIIADGVSTYIIQQEFADLDRNVPLHPLKIHYKDFSAWQNHLTIDGEIKKQERYWLNLFKDEIPSLNMPLDFPRPRVYTARGSSIVFEINHDITAQLKQLTTETETTLYIVLLSVYTILLAKYSRQEDIVVGSPVAGRRHADLEKIIGIFVNMLPMRNQPKNEKIYREFLAEVKQNALDAYENQEYPFENLIWNLKLSDDSGRTPLFDAVFAMLNNPTTVPTIKINTKKTPGETNPLNMAVYDIPPEKVHHELLLNVREEEGKLFSSFEYSTELYKETTARKITQHMIEILQQIIANPNLFLKDITISHDLIIANTGIIQEEQDDFEF